MIATYTVTVFREEDLWVADIAAVGATDRRQSSWAKSAMIGLPSSSVPTTRR